MIKWSHQKLVSFFTGHFSVSALCSYLIDVYDVFLPASHPWYCDLANYFLFSSTLCCTLLITSMTFDRFYSIMTPHKAAFMNTKKKAKIKIASIILFSFVYNIPHWFLSKALGKNCRPYIKNLGQWYNDVYFWLSMVINFLVPFVCLLFMNSCIICAVQKQVKGKIAGVKNAQNRLENRNDQPKSHDVNKTGSSDEIAFSKSAKVKNSETQIYMILFLVTFAFLLLTTPSYVFFFFVRTFNFIPNPKFLGVFYLCQQIAHKTFFVNSGINFFLYVLSGSKFRNDVLKLFQCHKTAHQSFVRSDGSIGDLTTSARV